MNSGGAFLKLRIGIGNGNGNVTRTAYPAQTSKTGTYSTVTHLFQTTAGQLPMPMYGTTGYTDNNVRWGGLAPPHDRPSTVLVARDVWGYTGSDAGGDHYAGYYAASSSKTSPISRMRGFLGFASDWGWVAG